MKHFPYIFIFLLVSLPLVSKSQSARFEGLISYQISLDSNTAVVAADKIVNTHARNTGSLTIQLFLCESNYEGGTLKGIPCGEVVLSESLKSGEEIKNFSSAVSFTRPLRGAFHPVVLLLEKVKGENVIIDFVTFDVVTIKKNMTGILSGKNS